MLLAALAYALETAHFVGDMPQQLADYLEAAYSFYSSKGLSPAPPCEGGKYQVAMVDRQGADTVASSRGGVACVEKLEFGVVNKLLAFHEVGHVFQLSYVKEGGYEWYIEALPEAMASVGSGDYYWVSKYFPNKLYAKNPFYAQHDDWYLYGAAFVWYLRNASDWGPVVKAATTREGAVRLYLGFLLGAVRGVYMDRLYLPEFEEVVLSPGVVRRSVELDGFSAAYFKVAVPRRGVVRVEVSAPLLSNIAIGRGFVVDNGTLLVALVNNSTRPVSAEVRFYYLFEARLLGGFYKGGQISLQIYAESQGEGVNGVVLVNGTPVSFRNGVGVYNFTGELRPYVLQLDYGGASGVLFVNLTKPAVSVEPRVLYLDSGGRGALNVSISNPNPIAIVCVLNGSGRGLVFEPREVSVPTGVYTYRVGFRVVDAPGGELSVGCGEWRAAVPALRPSYALDFDLDSWSGVLTAYFGKDVVKLNVFDLPADVVLNYSGYTAAVLKIPKPVLRVEPSPPRLVGIDVVYTISIYIEAPQWIRLKGEVRVGGSRIGFYQGGVFNASLSLRPGEAKEVVVSVGRLRAALQLRAPYLEARLVPLRAVVKGGNATVVAQVAYNMDVAGGLRLEFGGPGLRHVAAPPVLHNGSVVALTYTYSEVLKVEYALGNKEAITVKLPKPSFSISLVNASVTPEEFAGVFNITASVCGPSIDAEYVVDIGGRPLTLAASAGGCAVNYTLLSWRARYGPELEVKVTTSLGEVSRKIYAPPPSVSARVLEWHITDKEEFALVEVAVRTPGNYTYELLGRRVSGEASFERIVNASNGVAVLDYGFGSLRLSRPPLYISAQPTLVEANTPFSLVVELRPAGPLRVSSRLTTSLGVSEPISLGPGAMQVKLSAPPITTPGIYNVSLQLGPYVNHTSVTVYRVESLSLLAPSITPVGRAVEIKVVGRVRPGLAVSVNIAVAGCGELHELAPINGSLTLKFDKACTAELRAYTNASKAVATITWASLRAEVLYDKLSILKGLPVFAAGTLSARALLGDKPVNASVRVVGFFDKLGLVNFTVYVEYMGVVNSTNFVGFAAPRDSYIAANKTAALLPPQAREYFLYLFQKAVATGDWELVDGISRLYSAPPTPFALVARYLVERDLSRGRDPNIYVAEVLQRVEPFALGLAGGLTLALLRRLS
mgnify:FL=1